MPEEAIPRPSIPINFKAKPIATHGQLASVWHPKVGAPVNCLVLSDTMTQVIVHFPPETGRSTPCLRPDADCPHCDDGLYPVWQGWLAGCSVLSLRQYMVLVTEQAALGCPELLHDKVSLRGGRLKLERTGPAHNSPVKATFQPLDAGPRLPPAFDVQARLRRMWNLP